MFHLESSNIVYKFFYMFNYGVLYCMEHLFSLMLCFRVMFFLLDLRLCSDLIDLARNLTLNSNYLCGIMFQSMQNSFFLLKYLVILFNCVNLVILNQCDKALIVPKTFFFGRKPIHKFQSQFFVCVYIFIHSFILSMLI